MAVAHDISALFEQLRYGQAKLQQPESLVLSHWAELKAVLPDGGFPRGVVELAAPRALGGATSLALAAVRAGQARGEQAWCAWIDPEGSLYAPGIMAAGVALDRMLVVRPPRASLGRVAVKVVGVGAFEVVVVDMDCAGGGDGTSPASLRNAHVIVRKLALSAEPSGTTVILLTDSCRPRSAPWPVALRLELSRPDAKTIAVRVTKEKHGRGRPDAPAKAVPFLPVVQTSCGPVGTSCGADP
jgi:recombination protein RecA